MEGSSGEATGVFGVQTGIRANQMTKIWATPAPTPYKHMQIITQGSHMSCALGTLSTRTEYSHIKVGGPPDFASCTRLYILYIGQ